MEVLLRLQRRASYADYLAVEQNSDHRHELLDGVIVAIASGSDERNAIAGQLAQLLGNRETGSCRYYTSAQRFWIASRARGRYADGSIICGPPDHPAHDAQATTNPTVVLEVLSPSSEGDDDGDKRSDFQSLGSLEAYVLVAQDQWRVKIYRRVGGEWRATSYRDGDSFELPTLSAAIAVADVYDGILDAAGGVPAASLRVALTSLDGAAWGLTPAVTARLGFRPHGLVRIRRGLVRIRRGLVRIRRGLVRIRRGLVPDPARLGSGSSCHGVVWIRRGGFRIPRAVRPGSGSGSSCPARSCPQILVRVAGAASGTRVMVRRRCVSRGGWSTYHASFLAAV